MKWKYTIEIKSQFEDKTTPELIEKLATSLVKQLDAIVENIKELVLWDEETKENAIEWVTESSIEFGDLATESKNCEDIHDLEQAFNCSLDTLYDVGDIQIKNIHGVREKFIWIN